MSNGQKRKASLVETCASTAIGFVVAMVTTEIVFPPFGLHVSLGTNFWVTTVFTVVSVIRGYYVRRLFNHLHSKGYFA